MITIISPLYPPANKGGGPIKSISGVSSILEMEGVEYKVITNNKDLDGSKLIESEYLPKTIYLDKKNIFSFLSNLKNSDLIWFNTLYNKSFAFIPLLTLLLLKKTTILITPRGQLLYGSISKRKKLYLKLFVAILKLSRHNVVLHYTHINEKENSNNSFKKFKYVIFPNTLSGKIQGFEKTYKQTNDFVIGFFGRINPKKNIHFIIKTLPFLDKSIKLEIHGAFEDVEYKRKLDDLIEKNQLLDRVSFHGYYDKHTFIEKSKQINLIVVPSLSENFCHVFFEAIEVRKIVLASTGLPWEDANSYISNTIIPLDETTWIKRINEVSEMSKEVYIQEQDKLVDYYKNIHLSIQKETIFNFKKLILKNEV